MFKFDLGNFNKYKYFVLPLKIIITEISLIILSTSIFYIRVLNVLLRYILNKKKHIFKE